MIARSFALYAISDGSHVKIGKVGYHAHSWKHDAASAAMARRAELQTGNPRLLRVISLLDLGRVHPSDAALAEKETHHRLSVATRRAVGEWFLNSDKADDCMAAIGFVLVARKARR